MSARRSGSRSRSAIWRRYAKLHTQLNPYIRAADATYRRTGMPIMRHGLLGNPRRPARGRIRGPVHVRPGAAGGAGDQPGARTGRLYAPRGLWLNFWRAVGFARRPRRRLPDAPARRLAPRRAQHHAARAAAPPAAADPRRLADPAPRRRLDTLSPYGRRRGIVHLRDRAGFMRILAFPRGRTTAGFNESGRLISREARSGPTSVDPAHRRQQAPPHLRDRGVDVDAAPPLPAAPLTRQRPPARPRRVVV